MCQATRQALPSNLFQKCHLNVSVGGAHLFPRHRGAVEAAGSSPEFVQHALEGRPPIQTQARVAGLHFGQHTGPRDNAATARKDTAAERSEIVHDSICDGSSDEFAVSPFREDSKVQPGKRHSCERLQLVLPYSQPSCLRMT
jgi:hypothetical protein